MRRLPTLAVVALTVAAVFLPGGASAAPSFDHHVSLTGAKEVPAGDPNGHGRFAWTLHGTRLCYRLSAHRIGPSAAAHIHRGAVGVAGPVKVELKAPNPTSSACMTLASGLARKLRNHPGRFYVNVHTNAYPTGAIRAQLKK